MSDKMISKIEENANGNTVIQGSSDIIINNNYILPPTSGGVFDILASAGQYDAINTLFQNMMKEITNHHPMTPYFGVKAIQMGTMSKLISTPLVEDALKKFPKKITSTVRFRPKDYPGLNEEENIWDYAYRTQKHVKLDTKAYKEYLGDMEDPFPVMEYYDGMQLEIVPPEFPKAMPVVLKSGLNTYNTNLRRVPNEEYGMMELSNIEDIECSFDVVIRINIQKESTNISMTRRKVLSIDVAIQREKLIKGIMENKLLAITTNEQSLMTLDGIELKDLNQEFFKVTDSNLQLWNNLKIIEACLQVKFTIDVSEISDDDYYHAGILAKSLQKEWELTERCKSTSVIANHDRIHLEVSEKERDTEKNPFVYELNRYEFEILGIKFEADKLIRAMYLAKIANESRIKRDIDAKKEGIKMNLIPTDKGKRIVVYSIFENARVVTE